MIALDVTRLTPTEAAAFHQLRQLSSLHLREIALAWLEQGLEAAELPILASERDPIMSDVAPLFERVLRQLNVEPHATRVEAARTVERALLLDIVADDANTTGKVWQLLSVFQYGLTSQADDERYLHLISMFYSNDDDRMSGAEIVALEREMRKEASRLLSQPRVDRL